MALWCVVRGPLCAELLEAGRVLNRRVLGIQVARASKLTPELLRKFVIRQDATLLPSLKL